MAYRKLIDEANNGVPQNYFDSKNYFPALNPYQYDHVPGLDTGLINLFDLEKGRTNCTDTAALFGTPQDIRGGHYVDLTEYQSWDNTLSFWSCAFYPNLTRDFRASTLPSDNVTFLINNNVDTSLASAVSVATVLTTCLDAWCRNSLLCSSKSCIPSQLTAGNGTLSALELSSCLADICTVDANKTSNPDIAGIGVVIALLIQLVIALAACLYILLTRSYLHWNDRSEPAHETAEDTKFVFRFEERLTILLDDFQRAQCCFAIAVNIASIVTLRSEGAAVTEADRDTIALSTYAGTLPTTMVWSALLIVGNRLSTYATLLNLLTWGISLAVRYLPQEMSKASTSTGYIGPQPAACASNSPVLTCGFPLDRGFGGIRSWYLTDGLNGVSMLFVLVYVIMSYLREQDDRGSGREGVHKYGFMHALSFLIVLVTSAATMGVFAWEFSDLLKGGTVSRQWTFGQVVAVTLWLPTLLSFINDCILGTIRGRTLQLPASLEVVRVTDVAGLPTKNSSRTPSPTPAASSESEAKTPAVSSEASVSIRSIRPSARGRYEAVCSGANGPGPDSNV